jgi:hypothetical protein
MPRKVYLVFTPFQVDGCIHYLNTFGG